MKFKIVCWIYSLVWSRVYRQTNLRHGPIWRLNLLGLFMVNAILCE